MRPGLAFPVQPGAAHAGLAGADDVGQRIVADMQDFARGQIEPGASGMEYFRRRLGLAKVA